MRRTAADILKAQEEQSQQLVKILEDGAKDFEKCGLPLGLANGLALKVFELAVLGMTKGLRGDK